LVIVLLILAGLFIGKSRGALAGDVSPVLFLLLLKFGRQPGSSELILTLLILAFAGVWAVQRLG
jgi:hypothetical protein